MLRALSLLVQAPEEELLQTRIKSSLIWAENAIYEDCDQAFIPKLAERLSFAAFQPVSGGITATSFIEPNFLFIYVFTFARREVTSNEFKRRARKTSWWNRVC